MVTKRITQFKSAIAAISIALLPLISASHSAQALAQTMPTNLAKQFAAIKERTRVGAVAYALVEGDKVIATGGMGKKSLNDDTPVTADSTVRIGSITKTFTAIALMKLVEQNKLQLNQSVEKLLPSLPLENPYENSPVTLAMMLEHTAGLTDLTGKEFNYPTALSLDDAFKVSPQARVVNWQPGYYKSYTNAGAGYVSAAIEKVVKQDYDSWFNTEILKALGMSHSQLHWSPELENSLVAGYDSDLKTRIPYWHTLFRAFGGLNTTANDVTHFLKLLINNGVVEGKTFLSAESILRMETPKTTLAGQQGLTLGYGLGIRSELFRGHRIYQHGGDADGYLAHFGYNKESKRGYFVVINAFRHDIFRPFKSALNQWLIENLEKPASPVIAKVTPEHLTKLVGEYEKTTYRFRSARRSAVEVKQENNVLFIRRKNRNTWSKLIPVSKWLYRYEGDPEATLAFTQTENGDIHLQNGDESFKQK
ncbi:class A beta-lactamase-related serine hydrolase [Alteromonadaceae bacterium M269]|nr:class A beta-lactamase-related serine hydrolase [Alteromonadaceae bacterium M269]